jgi:ubiquinone/menaquinone biosynthesis C-methylase UbiE
MPTEEQNGRTEEERAYYSLNRKVFGSLASWYDPVVRPIRRLRREVASMLDIGPGSRVLDVATGTGEQAFAFAEKGFEVVGIDLSDAMLNVARRKNRTSNVTFRAADATELPFEDRTFDASCISFALHEMPRSIREKVVREMARVTKAGGAIVVVDYALPQNVLASAIVYRLVGLYERDTYAEFVRSDLDALLEGAGVEVHEHRKALLGATRIVAGRRIESAQSAP